MPFDPGGWESAGWPVWNSMRWRLWVPPGARVGPRWGILIRDNVSPKGSIAILNAIPMMDLDQHGHVILPARRSRGA